MKAGFRRAIALSLGLCAMTIPASAATAFTDVPSTYWGYSYIKEAASNGLVSGIGDNQYGPEQTLSNAQFVTMVCNLFYADQVKSQGTSSDWWRPYMNVAYANGLLSGTTVGQQYASGGAWSAYSVNGQISRYDMAQVMYNLSSAQKWESPDSTSLVLAQLLIQDFGSIPANYQMPVAYCYAKGLLSGDENSNFNGSASTTRAQAAVVLCGLNDAKKEISAPTYTNTSSLTNGLVASETNVANLVDELWAKYPNHDQWNADASYTSQRLGSGTGDRGFVYMLSDKIFGGMPVNRISDPADLRIGDVIALNNGSQYGLVCKTSDSTFSYVTCDSNGWIDWSNDMRRDDLDDRYDTVYTRYLSMPEPDDVLANGEEPTRANVEELLDELRDDRDYEEGETWRVDDDYESDVLGYGEGSQGFAYLISDEIFGDLDYNKVRDYEDLRIGDVIYDRHHNGLYGVVVDINWSRDICVYVSADEYYEEISWKFTCDLDDITTIYTRYPEDAKYENDRDEDDWDEDDRLTNGDRITESNVSALMDEILEECSGRYFEDDGYWDMDRSYDSNVFDVDVDGSEAFAYYMSDEIFGNRGADDLRYPEDLRAGDVIRMGRQYGIVDTVKDDRCTYYTVDKDGYIYRDTVYFEDDDIDAMGTRY